MKNFIIFVSLFLATTQAAYARTIMLCSTDKKGWDFKFVGETTRKIEVLVVHGLDYDGIPVKYIYQPSATDVFKGERYHFDVNARTLTITPDASDFPSGLVLNVIGCDA